MLEYTRRFDHLDVKAMVELELPKRELEAALFNLPAEQREALEQAATRIALYHQKQLAASWEYTEADGTRLGQKVTPLDRVGLYVPGGKAAYPSSVLMNAIPAKVAGVGELIMVVPTPRGEKNALVLAAAALAGVDRVFTLGGAQAVGALAYGTQTIPQVDKIVGPGNAYVAAAKRRVFGVVGIDMVAGPSEVLIIADGSTDPDWVAMDLFAQAEHDELAQSILLCPDGRYIEAVAQSIERLLPEMPRKDVISASLVRSRRPDPGARSGRGLHDRQPDLPGAPGTVGGRSERAGGPHPPRRRHLHRPLHLGIPGGLLRRPQPRAADIAQRALLLAARRLRLPEAHLDHRGVGGRRASARPHRLHARPWRGTAGPRPRGGTALQEIINGGSRARRRPAPGTARPCRR